MSGLMGAVRADGGTAHADSRLKMVPEAIYVKLIFVFLLVF